MRLPVLLILLLSTSVFSQTAIATLEVGPVQSAYVDRPGDLYILLKDNTLKKFDVEGKLVSEQSFPETPTLFDPRDGARLFLYNRKTNQCLYYTEEIKQSFSIEQQYAIEPIMVCSSGDHQIWVVDRSDWSIKRINPSQSKVLVDVRIDQAQFKKAPEFVFIREYQNFLFIVEKNTGILVFNSIGKQIKKISVSGIDYVGFMGEELYYKKGDKLLFYDLFDASERDMTVDPSCKFVFLTDARKYLVYETRAEIFTNP